MENSATIRTSLSLLGRVVVGVGALTMSAACSGGGGGGGGPAPRVVPKVDLSACKLDPTAGATALMANASQTELVRAKIFDKPYDRYDLEAVFDASTDSTVAYVASIGPQLWRMPHPSAGKCPTFYSVTEANVDMQKLWAKVSGSSGTNGGSLAGFYTDLCGQAGYPACVGRQVVAPTIMVEETSDRWTLVHEMMHFNFDKSRRAIREMPTDHQLQGLIMQNERELDKALKAYQAMPNKVDLLNVAKLTDKAVRYFYEQQVRGPWEDIAIEGTLISFWNAKIFKNVSRQMADSGVWYMGESFKRGTGDIRSMDDSLDFIQKEANDHFWTDVSDQTTVTKKFIDDGIAAVIKHIADAKEIVESAGTVSMPPPAPGGAGAPGTPGAPGSDGGADVGHGLHGFAGMNQNDSIVDQALDRAELNRQIGAHLDSLDRGNGKRFRNLAAKIANALQM